MTAQRSARVRARRVALAMASATLVGTAVPTSATSAYGATVTDVRSERSAPRSPQASAPGSERDARLRRQARAWEQRLRAAEAASGVAAHRVVQLTGYAAGLAEQADRAAVLAQSLYARAMAEDPGLLDPLVDLIRGRESTMDQAIAAAEEQREAEDLVVAAVARLTTARGEAAEAEAARAAVVTEMAELETRSAAHAAAGTAVAQAEFRPSYDAESRRQDRHNRAALGRWQRYLTAVAEADLTPPPADRLADPEDLPQPLRPLTARDGSGEPGLAQVPRAGRPPLALLPRETVRAVSEAFSRVGLPGTAGATGSDAYACGGLVSEVWARAGTALPTGSAEQWQRLQTVRRSAVQVGDAVYLGDDLRGIHRAGVYVGNDQMIAADPVDGRVTVQEVAPGTVYGIKRVTLPEPRRRTRVPAATAVLTGCGEVAVPEPPLVAQVRTVPTPMMTLGAPAPFWSILDRQGGWLHPLAEGSYSTSASFGRTGSLWSSGKHTGQDFAADLGTPVYASRAGVVTVETPAWAGNLVRIDHGDGLESWYAHLSEAKVGTGQPVAAGQLVGSVGSEGNSTGSHLHFEVREHGVPLDPMSLLP